MTPEELTQFVATQQTVLTRHDGAISRHDSEMAEIRATLGSVSQKLDRVGDRLEQVAAQQQAHDRRIALNQEGISELKASIMDLRNIVADYIRGRSSE